MKPANPIFLVGYHHETDGHVDNLIENMRNVDLLKLQVVIYEEIEKRLRTDARFPRCANTQCGRLFPRTKINRLFCQRSCEHEQNKRNREARTK